MTPDYIDIHSHLNFPEFDTDRDDILSRMRKESLWTITVGTTLGTSREAVDLAYRNPHVFACIGVHPTSAHEGFSNDAFQELTHNAPVVAVGECGFDYYRLRGDSRKERADQRKVFESQIQFACSNKLPLMFHCRPSQGSMDAYHDTLDLLESYKRKEGDNLQGVIHFFSGDKDVAQRFLDNGFYISFAGPITFAHEYHESIMYVPLSRMLADTDAPFAAPRPYRGQRNTPLYIKEIVRTLADIRGENLDHLKKELVKNAITLFKLKEGVSP